MTEHAPRLARKDDAPACARIVCDWIAATDWMPDGPDVEELTKLLTVGVDIREFWVIGEPIVGYLAFERETSQINGLYTAHPGSGAGKALVNAVKQGRNFVQLWTHEANTDAHRFYHREGFVTAARKAAGRGDGIPELRMEWHA